MPNWSNYIKFFNILRPLAMQVSASRPIVPASQEGEVRIVNKKIKTLAPKSLFDFRAAGFDTLFVIHYQV
jgi:hypothetical protein